MPYRDIDPKQAENAAIPSDLESKVKIPQHGIAPVNLRVGSDGPPPDAGEMLRKSTNGRLARAGNPLLQLQNQFGNHYVQQLINPQQRITVQPKLMLGDVDTPSEREADQIASQAMRGGQLISSPTPVNGTMTPVPPETESAINRAKGSGQPLPEDTQVQMSQALGTDLSGVRIHTDGRADSLNQSLQAHAFTTGQDIFFRQGGYNPGSSSGQTLLAHELTHVAQQTKATNYIQRQIAVNDGHQQHHFSGSSLADLLDLLAEGSSNSMLFHTLGIAQTALYILDKADLKETDYQTSTDRAYVWNLDVLRDSIETVVQHLKPKLVNLKENEAAKDFYKIYNEEIETAVKTAAIKASGEWQPMKVGINLYHEYQPPQPHAQITKQVVNNDEIDDYVPPQRQQEILDHIAKEHDTDEPIKPAYWVKDQIAWSGITEQGLRPVIVPESFSYEWGTKTIPEMVYRGSTLNPMQFFLYGGFRAWGTDMDLYYHTQQEQTVRQHSGYVSTTSAIGKAGGFAKSDGYIYEIDLTDLFRIKIGNLTNYSDEDEWVVPYSIPFKHVRRVMSMRTGQWHEFSKDKTSFEEFVQDFSIFSMLEKQDGYNPFKKVEESLNDNNDVDSYDELASQFESELSVIDSNSSLLAGKVDVIDEAGFAHLLHNDKEAKDRGWENSLIQKKKIRGIAASIKIFLENKGYVGIRLNGEVVHFSMHKANITLGKELTKVDWQSVFSQIQ